MLGKGHWNEINGSVLCESGQGTFQEEVQHVKRHGSVKRSVKL